MHCPKHQCIVDNPCTLKSLALWDELGLVKELSYSGRKSVGRGCADTFERLCCMDKCAIGVSTCHSPNWLAGGRGR